MCPPSPGGLTDHSQSNITQSCFLLALDDLCSELQNIQTPILQHRCSLVTGEKIQTRKKLILEIGCRVTDE